jgi:hypothetical protein
VGGDERPADLEQQEPELALMRREHGEHARAHEVEQQVRPRAGRQPAPLGGDEGAEDEQRREYLDELVHWRPPSRAVGGPGTA